MRADNNDLSSDGRNADLNTRTRLNQEQRQEIIVDALAETLDARLREWKPETAAEARERITEEIEFADDDVLDIARSRAAEQDVLDLLDDPPTRRYVASADSTRPVVIISRETPNTP